jgi:hypothetical protein
LARFAIEAHAPLLVSSGSLRIYRHVSTCLAPDS